MSQNKLSHTLHPKAGVADAGSSKQHLKLMLLLFSQVPAGGGK